MEQMTIEQVIAEQGINVLSLFDGISCGRVALDKAGIKVNKYYASEIDRYAQQVSEKNWPGIERMGDITKWREWSIDWKSIDLVLAGSPCQGFSFAGKQLAFDDPRSSLFFEFVNIYNHIKALNPNVKFLLENVKMKQEFKDIISSLLGVQPIMINSALLSAQNRQRLYWANWEFGQPEDLGIVLSDVLQDDDVEQKYFLTGSNIKHMQRDFGSKGKDLTGKEKCHTLTAAMGTGGGNVPVIQKINKKGNLKQNQEKASCLTGGANSGGNHSDMDILGIKDNKNPWLFRRLTPIECERLQTLPDDYTAGVSNTQRYKALGNGWTADVIAHILKGM